ncbi:hypothetical protein Acr_06g0002350 [Actinidia rufa]|uniref:Uncharacterized protein n=1 Tax=Actinidia rufa TaxID=165716 RepID=A0A7J0EP77_9ERIC|nr:hypothetical protein Acr_06g0002350 [Actinidia rufa]
MEFGGVPEPESNARPGTRSLPLEIDLNETPLPSPRETLAAEEAVPAAKYWAFSGGNSCGSCGKCFKCLFGNGSERLRGRAGLLDINASPPREAEFEGFIGDLHSSGHGVQARISEQNGPSAPSAHLRTLSTFSALKDHSQRPLKTQAVSMPKFHVRDLWRTYGLGVRVGGLSRYVAAPSWEGSSRLDLSQSERATKAQDDKTRKSVLWYI